MYHRSFLPDVDIDLYEGHCFYSKDLGVLANHWECVGCHQRFSYNNNYNRHVAKKWCTTCQPKLVCNSGKLKHTMNSSKKFSMGEIHSSHGKLAGGLSASLSGLVSTSIMHCVAMEGKSVWSLTKKKSWSMDTILRHQLPNQGYNLHREL